MFSLPYMWNFSWSQRHADLMSFSLSLSTSIFILVIFSSPEPKHFVKLLNLLKWRAINYWVCIHWQPLKIFFRITWPIGPNLAQAFCGEVDLKGHTHFQGDIVAKYWKITYGSYLQNYWINFKKIWHKTSICKEDSNHYLFKREKMILCLYLYL